ncbi:MAG TPA: hypothetical protein DDZ68_01515 [Parvularcula sp.]|nr:hypothetical protein [Parvularcula sp.]
MDVRTKTRRRIGGRCVMKVLLKDRLVILISETDAEQAALTAWNLAHHGHVLLARADAATAGRSLVLDDLGERDDACRAPINVVSASSDPNVRLIGNFAETPFELDGANYRSVESFWQGLKFPSAEDRARLAAMNAREARGRGARQGYQGVIEYAGAQIIPGTADHWRLMEAACRAKFDQNDAARAALLATGDRPLTHRLRRDSQTIPGVIMAEIWMRTRQWLRRDVEKGAPRQASGQRSGDIA